MDFQKSLKQAWEILTLKEPTMHAVAKDPEALTPALLMVGLGSLGTAVGMMRFPSVVGEVYYSLGWGDAVAQAALATIFGVAVLYITGYFAEKVFHSKLDMNGYVRVIGYASLVNVLGILPALSMVSWIWGLVVMCTLLSRLGKMQAGQIFLLILIELLVLVGLGLVMMVFGLGLGMESMWF